MAYSCLQYVDHPLLNFAGRRRPKLRPTRQIVPVSQLQKSQTSLLLHNTASPPLMPVLNSAVKKKNDVWINLLKPAGYVMHQQV
jgi:hypothetical protein